MGKYPGKNLQYYYTENRERGAARNYGVKKAHGSFVTFLDSDDRLLPHCLDRAHQLTQEQPEQLWFHLCYETRGEKGELLSGPRKWKKNSNRELVSGNPISCLSVFLKREIALQHPFDEDRELAGLEDWELWLRLAALYKLMVVNEVCSILIEHKTRSVLQPDAGRLERRVLLFIRKVKADAAVMAFIGRSYNVFLSSCYSYLSLHLALIKGQKKVALKYLIMSLCLNGGLITKRRFYAILKHLL